MNGETDGEVSIGATPQDIVMQTTIARQRLGKRVPEVRLSTMEGHPLVGSGR
jgi:hypothetical protein